MIDRFLAKVGANAGVAHGPMSADAAVALLCERVTALAGPAPVAVPAVDPVLDPLGAVEALAALPLPLLRPDDPSWRESVPGCSVGVTGCLAAVAETGTVALGHGPGLPRAVSLVPDAHVCVVMASLVVETFEEALPLALGAGLPANLVWVSGPSRSADIEKQITLGVHGPRTFEVIVVDDADRGTASGR